MFQSDFHWIDFFSECLYHFWHFGNFSFLQVVFQLGNNAFFVLNFNFFFTKCVKFWFMFDCFLFIFQNEVFDLTTDAGSGKEIATEWVRLRGVFIGSTNPKSDFLHETKSWDVVREVTKDKSHLKSLAIDGKIAAIGVLLDSIEILNRFVFFMFFENVLFIF